MADYTVDLTPDLKNLASEGSLDTALDTDGNSIQRQMFGIWIVDGANRKMVGIVNDGDVFNDDFVSDPSGYDNITWSYSLLRVIQKNNDWRLIDADRYFFVIILNFNWFRQ